jgi:ribosome biogenesis GTPase
MMTSQPIDLTRLGWDAWFEERRTCESGETLARVAAVDRDLLMLMDSNGTFRARLAGRYFHQHPIAQDFPCVGDWVCVEKQPADDFGLIRGMMPRRTRLRRKSAGEAIEYQMIAANVDTVIVVQSSHYDFNVNRLERYLVMVREGGAEACILLTKTDLVTAEVLAEQLAEIRAAGITAPVQTLSNVTHEGIDALKQTLRPAKTYCFVGSSGVGKSTLINRLIGREQLETQGVSGSGEGRHTTVRRELIVLPGGALIIDNPGMREFGILGGEHGIEDGFSDLLKFAAHCRFRNCSHTSEAGCAVREAVASGAISRAHYDNYLKLRDESAYYDLSYAEKRKKDRDFGRFLKSVKKDL